MKVFLITLVMSIFSNVYADNSKTANLKDGIMLEGHDPVSYFTSAKPVKGLKNIKATVDGVTYLFSSEENKKTFLSDTKKFQPAYEGWCATAVAGGYKYAVDPENYKITNNRLFLFYKGWKGDAKKDWVKSEPESIKTADSNWTKVRTTEE